MVTVFLGLCVGLLLGLTGAGGGILAIPALTLGLGWSLAEATPVALLAVGLAASLGALDGLRKGLVRYKAAGLMAGAGWLTSPLGLFLGTLLSGTVLTLLFSAVMLIVAARMYQQARPCVQAPEDGALQKNCMMDPTTGRLDWSARCSSTLALIGGFSGLLTGMLGVGGGFLIVPAFRKFSDVRMHGIVATSLMVVALVSLGTAAHLLWSGIGLSTGALLFIGAALGGMLGGRLLSNKVSGLLLQQSFALLCVVVSIVMISKALMSLG